MERKGVAGRKEMKLWLDSFLASGSDYKIWTEVPGVAQFLRKPKGCVKCHGKLVTFNLNSWLIWLKVRGGYLFRSKIWQKHRRQSHFAQDIQQVPWLSWFQGCPQKGIHESHLHTNALLSHSIPKEDWMTPLRDLPKREGPSVWWKQTHPQPLFLPLSTIFSKTSKHVLKSHQSQCLYLCDLVGGRHQMYMANEVQPGYWSVNTWSQGRCYSDTVSRWDKHTPV